MPELPEVETIRRDLAPRLLGRVITEARVFWPALVATPAPAEFCSRLRGQRIQDVQRRGKYLIFPLAGGECLLCHLKMSGRLYWRRQEAPSDPYVHAVLSLEEGWELRFADVRKFGRWWLVADPASVVGSLGPDPLEPDFTPQLLARRLERRSGPLKALLLDQTLISGVGNLYADEALFVAGLHPERQPASLTAQERARLAGALLGVLREALEHRGTSLRDYLDATGNPGSHQDHLRVYQRQGQPCLRCGATILRLTVRGRGTFLCPTCQG